MVDGSRGRSEEIKEQAGDEQKRKRSLSPRDFAAGKLEEGPLKGDQEKPREKSVHLDEENLDHDSCFIGNALKEGGLTDSESHEWKSQGTLNDQQRWNLVRRVISNMAGQGCEKILPLFKGLDEYKEIESAIEFFGEFHKYRQETREAYKAAEKASRADQIDHLKSEAEQANQISDEILRKVLRKTPLYDYYQLLVNTSRGPSAVYLTDRKRQIPSYDVAFSITQEEEDSLFPESEESSGPKRLKYSYQLPRCDCHTIFFTGKQGCISDRDIPKIVEDNGYDEKFIGKIGRNSTIYKYDDLEKDDVALVYSDEQYLNHKHTFVIDHVDETGIHVNAKLGAKGFYQYEISSKEAPDYGEYIRVFRRPPERKDHLLDIDPEFLDV